MLVLSRKIGERIVIGDGVEVSVVRIQGGRVMLGVVAPREVPVNREELLLRLPEDLARPNELRRPLGVG